MGYFILALVFFGLCFLADKFFQKLFRSKRQCSTGLVVKPSKYYAVWGLVLLPVSVAGLGMSIRDKEWALLAGCILVLFLGLALIAFYLSAGIFYDEDSFLYTAFGKKGVTYHYRDIRCQQLYQSGGKLLIELQMTDGKVIHIQQAMTGVDAFMDKAFFGWCRQKHIDPATCSFYDPQNSCWFPSGEVE